MQIYFRIILILFFNTVMSYAQETSILGKWKCIDDVSGKPVAVIEIYEENEKFYGKVLEIINPKNKNFICHNCPNEYKDKPVVGLVVVRNLEKKGKEFVNGQLLDPKQGKLYKCYITLEEDNKLKVRGYVGISLFGRTQYWYRMQ